MTPPWQTWLSPLVRLLSFVVIALSWYEFPVAHAVIMVTVLSAGTVVWHRVLPVGHSTHYLKLIVTSMVCRYANCVRSGERVGAAVMAEPLRKMGFDLP